MHCAASQGVAHDRPRPSAPPDRTRLTEVRARPNARPITAWLYPAAAAAAGYSQAAIGRAFGLARTSVSRVLSGGADERERP